MGYSYRGIVRSRQRRDTREERRITNLRVSDLATGEGSWPVGSAMFLARGARKAN